MKISLQWAQYFTPKHNNIIPDGVDALVERIGSQLGAVEEVIPYGERFEGVTVARVKTCVDHPNAEKLHLCKIDDGGKILNVDRDQNGWVQVVCGAPNVKEGMMVAWLPPGSVVPVTRDSEPFTLEKRAIRGEISNGMLASPRELTISDDHSGILEIDEEAEPGQPFVKLYEQNDTIIDVENKMFTHRPDCFGQLGIARELSGIQQMPFVSPGWYNIDPNVTRKADEADLPLTVVDDLPDLVPRFMAITMQYVQVKPSPIWLQSYLSRVGLRPINNVVDLTNYYMLLTGQPIHAYDYDKVKSFSRGQASLTVRYPKPGETINLLNGKTIEPRAEAMMVVAGDKHLACVGGAMGGADTEVDENTKNIIIEAATWDMYSMRRTAMEHGLFTDAVTRFTKGQSPLQNQAVLAKIVVDLQVLTDGLVASKLIDKNYLSDEVMHRGNIHPPVKVTTDFINERLGLKLNAEAMATILRNVEFKVDVSGEHLTVTAPFWRTDIEIAEDIVEEVGRLYGYDHLPLDLPYKSIAPAPQDKMLNFKHQLRTNLASFGANEVLTYSFVHGKLLDAAGQDPDHSFHIRNAISPDLQYYRQSLLPSLLEKVHANLKSDMVRSEDNDFAIFEINKTHQKGVQDPAEPDVPGEYMRLALVFAADEKTAVRKYHGAPYFQARRYLDRLLERLAIAPEYEPLDPKKYDPPTKALIAPYEPSRAATVKVDGRDIGEVGEFHAGIRKALKLPAFAAGFELDVQALLELAKPIPYLPLSRFPKVQQDINFRTPAEVSYGALNDFVVEKIFEIGNEHGYFVTMTTIDIYQKNKTHKQTTFRIWLSHPERTLTTEEVNAAFDQLAQAAAETLRAERV